jgi:DNA-directed RNA polymerase alpha subunit
MKEMQKKMAEQGPPPDPRLAAAQIRAQTDIQKVQAQNEGDMMELQTRLQIKQADIAARREEMQLTREIEMLKMANVQNLSLEQIKAKLADTAIKERGKKELFAAEQRLKLVAGSGI